MQYLNAGKVAAQVMYALLSLAMVSEHLSLDKYGVFWVCKIQRKNRSNVVKNVLESKEEMLTKNRNCSIEVASRTFPKSGRAPPLVKREYKESELKRVREKKDDLAIVFEERGGRIERGWTRYVEGRARRRDTYQFPFLSIEPTVSALSTFGAILDSGAMGRWALPETKMIHDNLQFLLRCYDLDKKYQLGLNRLAALDAGLTSTVLAGFALTSFRVLRIR